jgi:hypothetical protein
MGQPVAWSGVHHHGLSLFPAGVPYLEADGSMGRVLNRAKTSTAELMTHVGVLAEHTLNSDEYAHSLNGVTV